MPKFMVGKEGASKDKCVACVATVKNVLIPKDVPKVNVLQKLLKLLLLLNKLMEPVPPHKK